MYTIEVKDENGKVVESVKNAVIYRIWDKDFVEMTANNYSDNPVSEKSLEMICNALVNLTKSSDEDFTTESINSDISYIVASYDL